MSDATTTAGARVSSPSPLLGTIEVFRELYRYRMLVTTLVSRELKARYRGSALGFLWTILNPLLLVGVYSLVFKFYMRVAIENYAVFLLCGILPWNFFAFGLTEGTSSIVNGGSLITKSLFPPHILPTVAVLSNLCHFLFALPVLFVFIVGSGIPIHGTILLLPVVLLLQGIFAWGVTLALAALNVHYRDVQHILGNALLLWFFVSPIIYPVDQIPPNLRFAHFLNPMGLVIESYHQIFLYGVVPDPGILGGIALYAIATLFLGLVVFDHYRETFAELV